MKICTKLTIGASIVIAAMLLIVVFCLNISRKMHKEFELLKNDIVPGAIAMSQTEGMCQQAAHNLMDFMIMKGEEKAVVAVLKSLEEAGRSHQQHETHIDSEEKKAAEEIMAKIHRFDSVCRNIIDLKKQGLNTDELLEIENKNVHPAMLVLVNQLKVHKAVHIKELAASEQAVCRAYDSGTRIALLASAFIVLFAVTAVFLITRSMIRPLRLLVRATEKIGSGDLNVTVKVHSNDEIGVLSKSFNNMLIRLKETTASRDKLNKEISERKQVAESLRESEKKYRLLADNTLDCIWQMDSELRFTYVNPAVFPMLGFTPEEWTGTLLADHCSSEEMSKVGAIITEELQKKETYGTTFEMWVDHKNGTNICCEIISNVIVDENGNPLRFQGTTHDVSGRKKTEDRLNKTFAEIERFNKLMIGREGRVIEMKKEVNALLAELGREPQYQSVLENTETIASPSGETLLPGAV